MKKIGILFAVLLALLLCACKTTEATPEVNKPTVNNRVENVSPESPDHSSGIKKDDKKESVITPSGLSHTSSLSEGAIVTLCYRNGDTVIEQALTEEESATIISFLSARREKKSVDTDAFRDEICFEVSGYRFSIATDRSGYLLNCETGRYVSLPEEKSQTMYEICESYGASFPCD